MIPNVALVPCILGVGCILILESGYRKSTIVFHGSHMVELSGRHKNGPISSSVDNITQVTIINGNAGRPTIIPGTRSDTQHSSNIKAIV